MSEPYIVKETLLYSDGAEKVIDFTHNLEADKIEEAVAESIVDHNEPEEAVVVVEEKVEESVDEEKELVLEE